MSSAFAHLHVHTESSLLDGLTRMKDAFAIAAADGQTALAVTDHGTLGGIWKAKSAAAAAGVKLIPGIELYMAVTADGGFGDRRAPQTMNVAAGLTDDSDEDEGVKTKRYFHLTMLAATREGWHNMLAIVNASEQTKFGKYPLTDLELLSKHRAGLVFLTGCLGGPVLGHVASGNIAGARANLDALTSALGRERVFMEVMEHGIPEESAALPHMHTLSEATGVPLVATNDAHYGAAEHAHTHDAWLAIRTKATLDDPKRYRFTGEGYHLRTEDEMRALREEPWWQQAVTNAGRIADRIADDVVPDGSPKLPVFPTPDGFDSNQRFLAHVVADGADRKYGNPRPPEVSARLNEEWKVVTEMGFVDYFLILHDVVEWAESTRPVIPGGPEKAPILVGPGRGSAAGSLLAYVLGITKVDPLEHGLLFERFLEPGRSDFPDIDTDFEKSRREEVLDYLEHRWGKGHVALIGSYGVSKSRRSIKDAARLLQKPAIGNALSKLIPVVEGNPLGFQDLLDPENAQTAAFRKELDKGGDDARAVLELARGFDSVVNGASIHACGVVVSDQYLPDLIPLRVHKNGRYITQWDSKDVESYGLLKLDVLALRNLDIAHTAMDYIAQTTGETLSLADIPHPSTEGDARVERAWQLLRDGRTAGIFQMEGAAMTALAQDIQPDGIDDLSAILALFRPGPISAGMPEHYGLRKNGKEYVDYGMYSADKAEQEVIAAHLGKTYGLMAYQEQVMHLGGAVAGFDAGMRSKLRKAIGKKNKDVMAQVKGEFLAGAVREIRNDEGVVVSHAFSEDTAERLWTMFEGNASYAFNASHSYAYAYLAYYTAFLKANWPGAYGAAILANTSDTDRRVEALKALPAEGIEVLTPDVNHSEARSTPEGVDKVRIGLSEISGVGTAGEWVVRARVQGGAFETLHEVAHRVRIDTGEDSAPTGDKHMPSNQLIGLIEAGAMDEFGPRLGQVMMARMATHPFPAPVPNMEWGIIERSARQRQRLGVTIGVHPLAVFQEQVGAWRKEVRDEDGQVQYAEGGIPISRIPEESGAFVTVIGLLAQWTEGSYRAGRKAAIALEGSKDRIEGVMWDRELTVQKEAGIPPIGWPVAVSGRVTLREFEQEDEDGSITLVTVKQLTATRVDVVNLDDPIIGSLNLDVVVPDLVSDGNPEAVESVPVAVESVPEVFDVDFSDPPSAQEDDTPVYTVARAPNKTRLLRTLPDELRRAELEPAFHSDVREYLIRNRERAVLAKVLVSP